jgi:hypothetical protein
VAEKGVLSSPNVKPCMVLPPATAETVREFCVSDEISRNIPRSKGYVSINSEGEKAHLQK